jgi:hypothetical protein
MVHCVDCFPHSRADYVSKRLLSAFVVKKQQVLFLRNRWLQVSRIFDYSF